MKQDPAGVEAFPVAKLVPPLLTSPKRANIQNEPVLLFENKPKDSHSSFELLTIPEMAEFLKISPVSVRRLQQKRFIPFIKVGNSVRFAISDLMSYLEKKRVESIG